MKIYAVIYRKSLFPLVVFLLLAISSTSISARHIIGGEATYKCLGGDDNVKTFEITFIIYRDVFGGGAPFDETASFGLYRGSGNAWTAIEEFRVGPEIVSAVPFDQNDLCGSALTNIGVERGVYIFEVDLPVSTELTYQLAYQRCCRSNQILNIIDPDVTGIAVTVEILPFAQQSCDSSPVFDELPPVVRCVNDLFHIDCSVTDIDGDQTVYTFCDPLAAGGIRGINGTGQNECDGITPSAMNCPPSFPTVSWKVGEGFSFINPMGELVRIDQLSGVVGGTQGFMGSFVVGVCATTFRDGQLIGLVRRDFTVLIVSGATAVDDLDSEANLTVYPNPACTEITIGSLLNQEVFSIINMQGQEIFSGTVERVDITNLTAGVYFVRASESGRTTRFTVVR